jgi:hypothetical protein
VGGLIATVFLAEGRFEIDRVLVTHYGFKEKELGFIPSTLRAGNYDIKYQMGRDTESEAD